MRRLCLSEFRLVAPPVAVHDAHNQSERQVAAFVANLAVFQQSVCYARGVSKIAGEIHRIWRNMSPIKKHRIWRNMSPIKKLSKRDDQLSSYGTSTSSMSWTTSHCHWLENMFYQNIRQWATSGYLVTVEVNHHQLPNLLSNCGHIVKKWHTWHDWLTMTIRLLHLLSLWHWHWPNRDRWDKEKSWESIKGSIHLGSPTNTSLVGQIGWFTVVKYPPGRRMMAHVQLM